eukprot:CAMPEP_0182443576 /NCGR_PEP_ID=MMETSP1172-20130603/2281_1 /TAXON_ID=708627 /ORGANISM="Timspurckia oligopyrenoides, Strain CCMP3278" /LENGTH=710 /DNA_ID=CAMNT_0024638907 /DNA_START=43 /DNA_END=2175 /DNA_ORIENTATION=-
MKTKHASSCSSYSPLKQSKLTHQGFIRNKRTIHGRLLSQDSVQIDKDDIEEDYGLIEDALRCGNVVKRKTFHMDLNEVIHISSDESVHCVESIGNQTEVECTDPKRRGVDTCVVIEQNEWNKHEHELKTNNDVSCDALVDVEEEEDDDDDDEEEMMMKMEMKLEFLEEMDCRVASRTRRLRSRSRIVGGGGEEDDDDEDGEREIVKKLKRKKKEKTLKKMEMIMRKQKSQALIEEKIDACEQEMNENEQEKTRVSGEEKQKEKKWREYMCEKFGFEMESDVEREREEIRIDMELNAYRHTMEFRMEVMKLMKSFENTQTKVEFTQNIWNSVFVGDLYSKESFTMYQVLLLIVSNTQSSTGIVRGVSNSVENWMEHELYFEIISTLLMNCNDMALKSEHCSVSKSVFLQWIVLNTHLVVNSVEFIEMSKNFKAQWTTCCRFLLKFVIQCSFSRFNKSIRWNSDDVEDCIEWSIRELVCVLSCCENCDGLIEDCVEDILEMVNIDDVGLNHNDTLCIEIECLNEIVLEINTKSSCYDSYKFMHTLIVRILGNLIEKNGNSSVDCEFTLMCCVMNACLVNESNVNERNESGVELRIDWKCTIIILKWILCLISSRNLWKQSEIPIQDTLWMTQFNNAVRALKLRIFNASFQQKSHSEHDAILHIAHASHAKSLVALILHVSDQLSNAFIDTAFNRMHFDMSQSKWMQNGNIQS